MYYYLIIALQAFCVYHCYTNRSNYYWIFAIIFLPILGSVLYLFMNVFRKRDIEKVQEQLVVAINPTKRIKDLEKRFGFSATFENQVTLADAYLEEKMYALAITNYNDALKDVFANDFYVLSKLQEAHYHLKDFNSALKIAERILEDQKFKKSKSAFLYAITLEKVGKLEEAEKWLTSFNAPYNYYKERLELARFYKRIGKSDLSKNVYGDLLSESQNMSKQSYRANRSSIKQAIQEYKAL